MRWDRKKLPKSNLHVYGKNDTQIMVYNMRMWQKRGEGKTPEKKKTKELVTEMRTLCS